MIDTDLRALYQDVILDHGRQPRNFGALAEYTHRLEGYNPLCGDKLTLYLAVQDGVIHDIGFDGEGCAISVASASLMAEQLKSKTVADALALFTPMHHLLTTGELGVDNDKALGKLAVLGGVSEFPARVKCATLAWHTLKGALSGETDQVSTE